MFQWLRRSLFSSIRIRVGFEVDRCAGILLLSIAEFHRYSCLSFDCFGTEFLLLYVSGDSDFSKQSTIEQNSIRIICILHQFDGNFDSGVSVSELD
jgi:hypothetical protein